MCDRGVGSSMEHVRFRLTWYQRMMPLLPAAIAVTLMARPLRSPASSGPGLTFPVGVWLALPVVLLSSARFGVTLTPSEAVVHNLRRRTIRWADVQGIWVESSMGVRRVVICE